MTASSNNRRVRTNALGLVVAALLCVPARSTSAQDVAPRRSGSDLFPANDSKAPRQLDFRWSLVGAYDDNITADAPMGFDSQVPVKGTFGTENASLMFKTLGRHASFSATASSSARYYPDLKTMTAVDGSGNVAFAADVGARTRVLASQGLTYEPYYEPDFLGGLTQADSQSIRRSDATLTARASRGYVSNVGLVEQFSSRSALTFEYEYRDTEFSARADRFVWQVARARFSRRLTRGASLRLGYGYGTGFGDQSGGVPFVSHDLDIGIDYSRALAFSRRTTIRFGSGSSIVRAPLGSLSYRLNGDASLNRQIGRTWDANLLYHRGVQAVEGFAQPLYADTVLLRLGGLVTRRLSLAVSGGYSSGELGVVSTESQRYGSYTADAELRIAINRVLAVFGKYLNYRYDVSGTTALPFDVPRALNRQGFRFGLSGSLPLFRSKG